MIIRIAIDLSEHDSILEYKHDSADFTQLSNIMLAHPFVLVYDGQSMEQSQFYRQIDKLPQKSRDEFIRICKKIPRRAVPDWNGAIEQNEQSTFYSFINVAAMSKAKFHILYEFDHDTYNAPHPSHPEIECVTWKAIDKSHTVEHTKNLQKEAITLQSRRSIFWKERFAPVISADKWKRIKLVDRYLFLNDNNELDYSIMKFLLNKLNQQLTHPTEIEIFGQTNKLKGSRNKKRFNYYPDLVNYLNGHIKSFENIAAMRIYTYNSNIGKSKIHDRFIYLLSTRDLLYTYDIGAGLKILRTENIEVSCRFSLALNPIPDNDTLYTQITNLTPHNTTKPDYREGKVSAYIIP